MITWAEVREQLRRTLLDDLEGEPGEIPTWDDDQLLDAFIWGQRAISAHTARLLTFECVDGAEKAPGEVYDLSTETVFDLPEDVYEPLDISGMVSVVNRQGHRSHLDPLFRTRGLSPYTQDQGGAFWHVDNTLHLSAAPGAGATLEVRYFGYWPEPAARDDDDFPILLPRWAIAPVLYFAAGHALVSPGTSSAMIRQWNTRDESGRPQDNAVSIHSEWLIKRGECELARHQRQDRTNFFRAAP